MLCRCKMTACHSYSLHGRIAMLRLFCYVFAHEFLFNPQFDLEPDYVIRKGIRHRIQQCNLRREILSTFHTRVDNRSIHHFCIVFTSKLPLPFDDHHQNLIHPYRARHHSPPRTSSGSNQPCCHCSLLLCRVNLFFSHNPCEFFAVPLVFVSQMLALNRRIKIHRQKLHVLSIINYCPELSDRLCLTKAGLVH